MNKRQLQDQARTLGERLITELINQTKTNWTRRGNPIEEYPSAYIWRTVPSRITVFVRTINNEPIIVAAVAYRLANSLHSTNVDWCGYYLNRPGADGKPEQFVAAANGSDRAVCDRILTQLTKQTKHITFSFA